MSSANKLNDAKIQLYFRTEKGSEYENSRQNWIQFRNVILLQTLGFATKLIKAGEEITDTYCPTFAAIPKAERAQSLAKYNFVCNCTPCAEDWPTLEQLPRKFHGLPRGCYRIESKDKVISRIEMRLESQVPARFRSSSRLKKKLT